MANEYLEFIEGSEEILTELGEVITFYKNEGNSYSESTLENTMSKVRYNGVGQTSNYNLREINGTSIDEKDIQLWFYTSEAVPEVKDIFDIQGTEYRAMDVRRYTVQGVDVLYRVQLRI